MSRGWANKEMEFISERGFRMTNQSMSIPDGIRTFRQIVS